MGALFKVVYGALCSYIATTKAIHGYFDELRHENMGCVAYMWLNAGLAPAVLETHVAPLVGAPASAHWMPPSALIALIEESKSLINGQEGLESRQKWQKGDSVENNFDL